MKTLYIGIALLLCSYSYGQQEVMLTQFMFNKLSLNPAYAGNDDFTSVNITYRDQYNGFPGAPTSQIVSANLPLMRKSIGIGFDLQNQSIGITSRTSLSMMYAYKFRLEGKSMLSMGLKATGRRYSFDFTDDRLIAIQGLSLDPSIPDAEVSRFLMNVGFGLYFESKNYYLSLSSPGLIKGDIDFDANNEISQESRHVFLMGGATFSVADRLDFTPQILVKYAENAPFDMDLNFGLTLDQKYTGAIAYRLGGANGDVGESIDVIVGFQLTEQLMLGFSLDFTLSKLRAYDNGSLELVLGYSFVKTGNKVKMINPRYF